MEPPSSTTSPNNNNVSSGTGTAGTINSNNTTSATINSTNSNTTTNTNTNTNGTYSSSTFVIRPHPIADTLAILCVFNIFPSYISVLLLLCYLVIGQSSHLVGSTLSFVFKHDLKIFTSHDELDEGEIQYRRGFNKFASYIPFIGWIMADVVIVITVLMINPNVLEYTHLLSKAFVASNLASNKSKYVLHSVLATTIFKIMDYLIRFSLKHLNFESDTFPFDYLQTYNSVNKRPVSIMWYYFSKLPIHPSRLSFGIEQFMEILYSTLAIYTIMHNINPSLQRLNFVSSVTKSIDEFATIYIPQHLNMTTVPKNQPSNEGASTNNTTTTTNIPNPISWNRPSRELKRIQVPSEISKSRLPFYILESSTPNSESRLDGTDSPNGKPDRSNGVHFDDTEYNMTPASFPKDRQISNIHDISSSTLVVAQNFENFCTGTLFPNFKKSNANNSSLTSTSSSYSGKSKSGSLRSQQPIWAFVSAAKTMFSRQDLYSGEYYQHNALVSTRNDEFKRSYVGYIQCFTWLIAENAVGFELNGAYIQKILVRVNGVIWHQVASGRTNEREMVIVGGLSPLSQYDIEFVNINEQGELELLATTTVSTIQANRTLTESKPSNPIQTLQTSLCTTAEAVKRERFKLRKLKMDSRKRCQTLKTEIDNLNNRGSSNDDTRNYKKLTSLKQAFAKFDDEFKRIEEDFKALYTQENDLEELYLNEKIMYEQEMIKLLKVENDYKNKVGEQTKKIKALESELSQALQKKEKLMNKKSKLLGDISKFNEEIEALKKEDLEYKQQQRTTRANLRNEKFRILDSDINKLEESYNKKVALLQQQGLLGSNNISNSSSAVNMQSL